MLHDRLHHLSDAFYWVERRLDRLEGSHTETLDLCKRCDELFAKQTKILERLAALDCKQYQTANNKHELIVNRSANVRLEDPDSTEARLSQHLAAHDVKSYKFKRVPEDYYAQDLDYRSKCLQAASIKHLCKSLIVENTHMPEDQQDNTSTNSRFYLVVVQYAAKYHGEKLKRYLHKLNGKLGIQYFRLTFAPAETSEHISGYAHGSVTPVGLKTNIPVILSHKIAELMPSFFWMGGGEEDLKLGMIVDEFIQGYKPLIVDCTY